MTMKILTALIFLVPFLNGISQKGDSAFIRSIYDEALLRGEAHENLRSLCKSHKIRRSISLIREQVERVIILRHLDANNKVISFSSCKKVCRGLGLPRL